MKKSEIQEAAETWREVTKWKMNVEAELPLSSSLNLSTTFLFNYFFRLVQVYNPEEIG